jgi:type II secretory pathway pseudopilin PulG
VSPLAILLSLLGILAAAGVTVWATLRGERRAREESDKRQIQQVEQLLQTMVVDRIDAAFAEIAKVQKGLSNVERSHSWLLGFLRGTGFKVPEVVADDLVDAGK